MKIDIPKGEYIKKIDVTPEGLTVDFGKKKKVALVFISLNPPYWPYLAQCIKDCRKFFLPQHHVDYFAWTDFDTQAKEKQLKPFKDLLNEEPNQAIQKLLGPLTQIMRLYEYFYPQMVQQVVEELRKNGLFFKREGMQYMLESNHPVTLKDTEMFVKAVDEILTRSYAEMDEALKDVNIIETEPVEWPAPTLMRYHLFLNEEERLKEYDHIFYLDADMRVVGQVGDEILNNGLMSAEHPMYSLRKEYIPPYEPNPNSTAYIHRPGRVVDENGKMRFRPFYYAGGFQGGTSKDFLEAMRVMKKNIDTDFNKNYVAIWNDESHWNKYLFDYQGELIVLPPSYVYPDSLVKEYYEPAWGRSYEPKIITLTKPFTLSAQGAEEIHKAIGK